MRSSRTYRLVRSQMHYHFEYPQGHASILTVRALEHAGPKGGFDVVRYHSLAVVEESLPPCLQPIAWTCGSHHAVSQPPPGPALQPPRPLCNGSNGLQPTSERVLMAIAHKDRPHYGVQFHPESIATAFGNILVHNFKQLTQQHRKAHYRRLPDLSLSFDFSGNGNILGPCGFSPCLAAFSRY